jgi:hypothetical protein
MALKDRLKEVAAGKEDAAVQAAVDATYKRWTAKMEATPSATSWSFSDPLAVGAIVEKVKEKLANEGYTVTFKPARTGGFVEISEL